MCFFNLLLHHDVYANVQYFYGPILPELGLGLGWYGQLIRDLRRRSSILQQPARDRVGTAVKPVAASRLWCAVPVKQRKKNLKLFLI